MKGQIRAGSAKGGFKLWQRLGKSLEVFLCTAVTEIGFERDSRTSEEVFRLPADDDELHSLSFQQLNDSFEVALLDVVGHVPEV